MKFDDHFSHVSDLYARFRPTYPSALFQYLANVAPSRNIALDCGTGTGQTAIGLAQHFQLVVATDASVSQIANAKKHSRVIYVHSQAENNRIKDQSIDLLTVSQALHWFDLDAFYSMAKRVLCRNGVIACWCYESFECDPEIERLHRQFKKDIVGPYWSPKVRLVDDHYLTVAFPFQEFDPEKFMIEMNWTLPDLFGYYESWSSTQQYRNTNGENPIDKIRDEMSEAWGNPATIRTLRWPIHMRIGRSA